MLPLATEAHALRRKRTLLWTDITLAIGRDGGVERGSARRSKDEKGLSSVVNGQTSERRGGAYMGFA